MNLKAYMQWALQQDWLTTKPIKHIENEDAVVDVVHQNGRYQIERVFIKPDREIPTHRHPLINAYTCPLKGKPILIINHKQLCRWPRAFPTPHTMWHSVITGKEGALYLNVQYFLSDTTNTVDSWEAYV